jgi:small subunit ribosomal protein S17
MADDKTPQTGAHQSETQVAEPQAPTLSAGEQRASDAHRAKSQRPARTPEERDAERGRLRQQKAVARSRRRRQEKARRAQAGPAGPGTPPAERPPSTPQVRLGRVVSAKADKTITVSIDIARRHRRYEKIVRSTSTLHAHDETNDAHEGDLVRVVESRPLSRTKRWRLVEVLERAK